MIYPIEPLFHLLSAVLEIEIKSRISLIIVLVQCHVLSLYASWIARRRAVSSIARCIESVILSAYIMTFPSAFRSPSHRLH